MGNGIAATHASGERGNVAWAGFWRGQSKVVNKDIND